MGRSEIANCNSIILHTIKSTIDILTKLCYNYPCNCGDNWLVTVEFVQHEILESAIKVYNFEIEEFHTYFVGENGVFVHNGCKDEIAKEPHGNSKDSKKLSMVMKYSPPQPTTTKKHPTVKRGVICIY